MKLPFCRAALLAAALGACLVGCKPAATDEPAAFATAETAEAAATLTPTAATTAQPVAAEIGTVLPATEDAGRSYMDETLFIGDSNTVRYTMYADETGTAFASVDNSIGVVSMGAGAITTLKCEKFKGFSNAFHSEGPCAKTAHTDKSRQHVQKILFNEIIIILVLSIIYLLLQR